MQRRHFEFIAGTIAKLNFNENNKRVMVEHFADELAGTNENFDRERFITACMTGKMGKGRSHKNVKG